jgi:hypothetical protein
MVQGLLIGVGLIAGGVLIAGVLLLARRPLLKGFFAPSPGYHDNEAPPSAWAIGSGDSSGCGDGGGPGCQ